MDSTAAIIDTAFRPAILAEVKKNIFAKNNDKKAKEATDRSVANLANIIDRALKGEFPAASVAAGLRKKIKEYKIKNQALDAIVIALEKSQLK